MEHFSRFYNYVVDWYDKRGDPHYDYPFGLRKPSGAWGVFQVYLDKAEVFTGPDPVYLQCDPRISNYQLFVAIYLSATLSNVPLVHLQYSKAKYRPFPVYARHRQSNKEYYSIMRRLVTYQGIKHSSLVFCYEWTRTYISNEHGINAYYGPISIFFNATVMGSLAALVSQPYLFHVQTQAKKMPTINMAAFAPPVTNEVAIQPSWVNIIRFYLRNPFITLKESFMPMVKGGLQFGTFFLSYESLLQEYDPTRISFGVNVYCAYLASFLAILTIHPFDKVDQHFRITDISKFDTTKRVVSEYGFLSLWRGSLGVALRGSVYYAITFGLYGAAKRVLLYAQGYTLTPFYDIPKPGVPQFKKIEYPPEPKVVYV